MDGVLTDVQSIKTQKLIHDITDKAMYEVTLELVAKEASLLENEKNIT